MSHDGAEPATSENMSRQRAFWNDWNAHNRELDQAGVSKRQLAVVTGWLTDLGITDAAIIEVGCGAGWAVPSLMSFGSVTATDLADDVLDRARDRNPEAQFVAGDFLKLDLGQSRFDVAVSLEVLSHVADQRAFLDRIRLLVRDGGYLMLATQNRPVLERYNSIPPPAPGQLRRWVDAAELRSLLEVHFDVLQLFSVSPVANKGPMRVINSWKLNRPVRAVAGNRVERLKERMGLGWTLMALARARSSAGGA